MCCTRWGFDWICGRLRRIVHEGRSNRIGVPGFRRRIVELCGKICRELDAALEAAPGLSSDFRRTLNEQIRTRAANIAD